MSRFHASGRRSWMKVQKRVLLEQLYVCERCNESFINNPKMMEVHHRKPLCEGGERFRRSNLMAVCIPCHKIITAEWRRKNAKGRLATTDRDRLNWFQFVDELRA